ncbi:DUF5133 domain-containing protein [Streptomyces albipurpureus]|uniref:DUF5133 domain-containing protein n=1 Tax=Streptomyces albipurpureus TaxID=2897419 RepID=A0ABT0UG62_9ACTN|nr:DUF5133 domain-containing protein [Streptomyces sp. CWNU-1]MCM2387405.1 DUF5133 domain-containing protein [Streptomyces sp. CWNU-1]
MVLTPHPAALRDLVERYDFLRARAALQGATTARECLEDLVYTLCVCTGTRHEQAAVAAARRFLAESDACAGVDKHILQSITS